MRLTRKTKSSWGNDIYYTNGQISSGIVYIDDNKNFTNATIDKLGQLEDIEDELGIDLLTLFKALKDGVYMSTKHFDIVYCKCPKIVHYKCGWKILVYGATLSLTTYSKTWALTKEELNY